MAIVLPVMKPKRPAVTVCICLAVISLYMLLLGYINSSASWYVQWVLPVFLMITISSAIMFANSFLNRSICSFVIDFLEFTIIAIINAILSYNISPYTITA